MGTTEKASATRADAVLTGRMHEAFTVAADQMVQRGFVTQDQRKALSHVLGQTLDRFNEVVDPAVSGIVLDAASTEAIANKAFDPAKHPRATSGEHGGEFTSGNSSAMPTVTGKMHYQRLNNSLTGNLWGAREMLRSGYSMGKPIADTDRPGIEAKISMMQHNLNQLAQHGEKRGFAQKESDEDFGDLSANDGVCPTCEAHVSFPSAGWYQCPNCGEPFYAKDYIEHDDTDMGKDWLLQAASNPDVSEADIPKELTLARLIAPAPDYAQKETGMRDGIATKPYNGVPSDKWSDMERCVLKVMAGGKHDKSSAIAICHTSIMGKGEKEAEIDPAESAIAALPAETRLGVLALIGRVMNGVVGRTKARPARLPETLAEVAAVTIADGTLWDGGGISHIFKEKASGKYRWVMFSSSAYEDNDSETASLAALDADAERMTATKEFGPLRFWHVGEPNRATLSPGPGLDLGVCDFSAMHGNIAIESGLFNDNRVAEALIPHMKELGVSRGFFHPIYEPDDDGTFHSMHTFERSLLPRERASNRLTRFYVTKEVSMREDKRAAFKNLLPSDLADEILAAAGQLDESAARAGLKNKDVAGQAIKAAEATAAPAKPAMSPAGARGPQADIKGLHNHLHAHLGKMHTHEHYHPKVHDLMNTNDANHNHEHGDEEMMSLKEVKVDEQGALTLAENGIPLAVYTAQKEAESTAGDSAADTGSDEIEVEQPADTSAADAGVDEGDEDEDPPEDIAAIQAAAFKEEMREAFVDVLTPFLQGLAGAAQKQADGIAIEIGEVRAELKAVKDQNAALTDMLKDLLGEEPAVVLKEMRASQAAGTIIGEQDDKGNTTLHASGGRFKEQMPQADPIGDFLNDFVMAGNHGGGDA